MDIIRFSNDVIMGFLGGPQKRVKGLKYRFNKFIIKVDYKDDVYIWYNVFTGAIVALKGLEVRNLLANEDFCNYEDILVQHYFIVPENFNEDELILEYRKRKSLANIPNPLTHVNGYTILTTTQCNARCFYCYQNITKHKSRMSKEIAEKVAKYIIDHTFVDEQVNLGWFGGEPLFNQEVMDIITTKVEGSGRNVQSGIISNSYLFNEQTCIKAVRDWHIRNIQVTLDGTAEIYNKTKNYIYKNDSNPFQTIINNMHNMLKYGMVVSVRLNVGTHNGDNLKELVKFLAIEFRDEPNLSVYVHDIFDMDLLRTDIENEKIFKDMIDIERLISKLSLRGQSANVPLGIRTTHCMVDTNHSVVIMPNGDLGLCEHYDTEHLIGHIDNPLDYNLDEILVWRKLHDYGEICDNCGYKPACMKLELCPDTNLCNKYEKEFILERAKLDIIYIYEDWLKSINISQCNNCNGTN